LIAVLDASAAVRTAMDPAAAFRAALDAADLVIAPELIVAEVCSAYQKYVRARVLSWIEAEESIEQALALVDKMQPLRELVAEVLASHRGWIPRCTTSSTGTGATNGRDSAHGRSCPSKGKIGMGIDAGATPEGAL